MIVHRRLDESLNLAIGKPNIDRPDDKNKGDADVQSILDADRGSLVLSFLFAALPIATVLVALGVLRRPAWQASLAGLIVGLIIAIVGWHFPVGLALNSVAAGAVFALWPVMWIVFNALLLYNIAVDSGRFDAFRDWIARLICRTTGASCWS